MLDTGKVLLPQEPQEYEVITLLPGTECEGRTVMPKTLAEGRRKLCPGLASEVITFLQGPAGEG